MRWLMLLLLLGCPASSSDDSDGDGWGAEDDCDDADPSVFPGATEVDGDGVDQDCDGFDPELVIDDDGDGSPAEDDCDDADPAVHPGAFEYCDGDDDNCDGVVDEGFDEDADGVSVCGPDGLLDTADDDCDDDDPDRFPGNVEDCDGTEDDCDGLVDEGFDVDGDGVSTCGPDGVPGTADDDCADDDPDVQPGIWDDCDGVDSNCNGEIDEDGPPGCVDDDGDGDGYPASNDCDDGDAAVHPGATEACNGRDDDCDNEVDEGFDGDGDGWTTCGGDCNDLYVSMHPQAPEIPGDGLDQDCDGADQESDCAGPWFFTSEVEPNDSSTSPNLITTAGGHTVIDGSLSCGSDADHLILAFDCGGPVTFRLDGPGFMELVVRQGSVLVDLDGTLPLEASSVTAAGQLQVEITCGAFVAGDWVFEVDWD